MDMNVGRCHLNARGPERRARRAIFAAVALAMAASHSARAASSTWDGNAAVGTAGDGVNWSDANNWTTAGVVDTAPSDIGPGDDVTFNSGAAGAINLSADRFANSLAFNDSYSLDPTATKNAHMLTLTGGAITTA